MFGTILISIVTLMHVYVFWRAVSVPFIKSHIPKKIIIGAGLILWILFYLGRVYGHYGEETLAKVLEFIGLNWMAGWNSTGRRPRSSILSGSLTKRWRL